MSGALLALWIALIGADRIDLAGGHGPFIVTPFLALTPLVVIAELVRRARQHASTTLSRQAVAYATIAALLLGVVVASALLSDEVLVSGARSTLLLLQIAGTFAVAILASDRPDLPRILAIGALLSLPLFVFCDVMEALLLLGRGPELLRAVTVTLRFDDVQILGALPRPGGPVMDSNRAGFVLVCYIVFIARGIQRRWLRGTAMTLAALLLLATVSRSAGLAAIATLLVSLISRRHRASPGALALGALGVAAIVSIVFLYPRVVTPVEYIVQSKLATRISFGEESAHEHVTLLKRGLEEGSESVPRSLIGIGYGDGYRVLQDIFPGNRYGNFHSLYVTMFAEAGIVAALLAIILMVTPLVRGGPWRPLVAGAVAFNVFYQTTAEPVFWFVLAMAWLAMPPAMQSFRAVVARGTRNRASAHS